MKQNINDTQKTKTIQHRIRIIHLVCPQNFPKNLHFLTPDKHTYMCVSGGKKCKFFEKICRSNKGMISRSKITCTRKTPNLALLRFLINPSQANISLLYPLNISGNHQFSDVFRGVYKWNIS